LNTGLVSDAELTGRAPSLRLARIRDNAIDKSGLRPGVEALLVSIRIETLVIATIRVKALVFIAVIIARVKSLVLLVATAVGDARRGVGCLEGAGHDVAVVPLGKLVVILLLVENSKQDLVIEVRESVGAEGVRALQIKTLRKARERLMRNMKRVEV
jgi:hypothetical protein